jgi:hypothetical protein
VRQQVFARFDLTGADFQVIVHLRRVGAPNSRRAH